MDSIQTYASLILALLTIPVVLWHRRGGRKRKSASESKLPWAPTLGNRCKARLKKGEDPEYFGRCELEAGHYSEMWEDHHALERGMILVRWDKAHNIRYEQS